MFADFTSRWKARGRAFVEVREAGRGVPRRGEALVPGEGPAAAGLLALPQPLLHVPAAEVLVDEEAALSLASPAH